jgi:sulfatase modifying factor 1
MTPPVVGRSGPSTRMPLALGLVALALAALGTSARPGVAEAKGLGCPEGMTAITGFCIDVYEAATDVVTLDKKGRVARTLKRHSPFAPIGDAVVKAVSKKGRTPQGHISQEQAAAACRLAGKRLCTDQEWLTACKGKSPSTWPYGDDRVEGRCNDNGTSGMNLLFGHGAEAPKEAYTQSNMNDERLNQFKRSLAPCGSRPKCKSSYGTFDMVGNLHEWTSASGGTFRGGYYLDVTINGSGCDYKTTAHSTKYFDYSTGFRCCWAPGDRNPEKKQALAGTHGSLEKGDVKDASKKIKDASIEVKPKKKEAEKKNASKKK